MEPDFLPNSKILVFSWMYTPGKLYTLARGGVRGGLIPPMGSRGADPLTGGSGGQRSPSGGFRVAPPKLKTDVNFPCKSLIISSQSGPFIRRMI